MLLKCTCSAFIKGYFYTFWFHYVEIQHF
uniref:Uncharacterized protein n=1 Tax=Anguilla anguilla TaxID=7936 RepID=A0A0E9R840_ANGAN